MKLNLKDLTILIPTYKRNQYLLKNLSFWEDYSTNIIILDGGKNLLIKINSTTLKITLNIFFIKKVVLKEDYI